jgi:ribonuclease P protein component
MALAMGAKNMNVAKQFTLGKKERLKSRKRIEQLFSGGKTFTLFPFRAWYLIDKIPDASLQFGIGVSSKNFKKAVDRNRIKRQAREAWRLQKLSFEEKLLEQNKQLSVFIIYTSKDLPRYEEIHEKMGKVINKLQELVVLKK